MSLHVLGCIGLGSIGLRCPYKHADCDSMTALELQSYLLQSSKHPRYMLRMVKDQTSTYALLFVLLSADLKAWFCQRAGFSTIYEFLKLNRSIEYFVVGVLI